MTPKRISQKSRYGIIWEGTMIAQLVAGDEKEFF